MFHRRCFYPYQSNSDDKKKSHPLTQSQNLARARGSFDTLLHFASMNMFPNHESIFLECRVQCNVFEAKVRELNINHTIAVSKHELVTARS